MGRIFNMDNKFFVFMGRMADIFILTILTIICSLPVITIGASITALYYVTLKMVRDEESYIVRSFFKSFKQNFRQATIINLIMLAVGFILFVDWNMTGSMDNSAASVMQFLFTVITIVYFMILLYVYPVLSRFYNSIKNTFTNSALMAVRHLPYTILMLAISVCPCLVLFIPSASVQMMAIMLVILFGLGAVAYCQSIFFVKIFDKYVPAEPAQEDEAEAPKDGEQH